MIDNLDYPVQLLQPDGARVCRPEYDRLIADLGPTEYISLYRDMVISRRIDTAAVALQRQGEIGLWAPLLGQEAAQVGSAHALKHDDFAFVSYREHAVAYCRGVPPEVLTHMWRGCSHSAWDPDQFNVTNPAIVVGSQGLHATGYALGAHLDGAEIATIAYFGDGATSQGDIAEAMGFAASFRAGVVFFCQNNQWAISEPVSLQSRTPISHRGDGYGIPSCRVDGNDVLAVLAVTRAALAHVREGSGPTFIEAITCRMGPHTTSDDPSRYRSDTDMAEWRRRDPIERMRAFLERRGILDETADAEISTAAEDVAARLRHATIETPDPPPSALFEHVYAGPHPLIDFERERHREYLASFDDQEAMS
ncbi:pyruvate dehydrogenase (acetyl-transferring) E1 component subunit alpha [Rhodococcus sp. IEGM 1379]|uniref:pyruvate dehydrogenase (acetyl-transferring) E1 component subunit alpha n=1 Tax=Rhodococcus sp. IEGM 1379 TaxID=3047086 RepID=UPI0024B7D540|nr:pyruvate dehydrogenase (acetyl-transferring) E1 component subunit alpha [Rhodococcus sp. IEGM 1379]MDI9918304.1 pyruvate dehydrogenase (acetyl-transferring) E1 component subunit alpha [Rhodococcus sp. IEGM 1379]